LATSCVSSWQLDAPTAFEHPAEADGYPLDKVQKMFMKLV